MHSTIINELQELLGKSYLIQKIRYNIDVASPFFATVYRQAEQRRHLAGFHGWQTGYSLIAVLRFSDNFVKVTHTDDTYVTLDSCIFDIAEPSFDLQQVIDVILGLATKHHGQDAHNELDLFREDGSDD